jgi:streptogramin lyase
MTGTLLKTARILSVTTLLALFSIHLPRRADADPVLFVANQAGGTIEQFSTSGADLGSFKSGLIGPSYLAVDRAGDLYVSNFAGGFSVQEYSPQGALLLTIPTPYSPGGLAVTAAGNILVGDYFGGNVHQYSSTGKDLGIFSNPGLDRSYSLALDSQGNLYVSDQFGGVVRRISPTGVDEGNFLSNVPGVTGITFDSQGNLYAAFIGGVSPDGIDKIREYSPSGAQLLQITQVGLSSPTGVAIGPDGNLYVTNGGNNTVHKFSPTGTDLGVFASTGLDVPLDLVFGNAAAVPEPSVISLAIVGVTLCLGFHTCRGFVRRHKQPCGGR